MGVFGVVVGKQISVVIDDDCWKTIENADSVLHAEKYTHQTVFCDVQRLEGVEETKPIRKIPQRVVS